MTIEIILWLAAIAGAFYLIMAIINYFENKRIRKRKRENDELSKKVWEKMNTTEGKDNISFFQRPRARKHPVPDRKNALPPKPKQKTVDELKEEIGEASLINEKVTVSADDETLYETKRRKKVVEDDEILIEKWSVESETLSEPEWAKAMRESAEQESKSGITKEYVLGPNERVIDVNGHTVVGKKSKSVEDRVRELVQKKQDREPFYKNHNKKEWE